MNRKDLSTNALPLISVLVPVYNHANFVTTCLNSIRDNGWKRLELIIIDDGSKDDSYQIVSTWIEENKQAFENVILETQTNSGVTKTLNRLIKRSTGDFLVFIASDDYLLENSIQVRFEYLTQNPTKLAVFTDAIGIDDHGKQICTSVIQERFNGHVSNLEDNQKIAKELILNWCVPGPVFMARKETYQEVGFYDEQYFIEDRYFYLKLLSKDKLGFINKSTAAYRLHAGSSTGSKAKQIAVGSEVIKIERNLLDQFSGLNRFYLLLQIWSNYSQVLIASGYMKPLLFLRCLAAKVVKRVAS